MSTFAVTHSDSLAPYRCWLVRSLEDGTECLSLDPDGEVFDHLGDAIDQGEALAGLNPDAAIRVTDAQSNRVAYLTV